MTKLVAWYKAHRKAVAAWESCGRWRRSGSEQALNTDMTWKMAVATFIGAAIPGAVVHQVVNEAP